jgi:Na+-transporting NADH:ubiquinone oxidoreductase subunit D
MLADYRKLVLDPLLASNPITVQILGLCSALAVTSTLWPAIVMSIAVTAVLMFSNLMVSMLRKLMPRSIRLIVEVTVIASAVIVVDQVLRAFVPDVAAILSVFVGLIVTNCLILGRAEAYAMQHGALASIMDGLGNGLGYSSILILVGSLRELLGSGSLLGYTVLPTRADGGWYVPNELMLLAPSAFFIVGLLIWASHALRSRRPRRAGVAAAAPESR